MSGFFKRYVVHNFGLKVLSLVLATGLWFMISRDEQPAEVAIRSPILFQDVPSQLEISSETVPEALIRVRGPERIVRHLTANEVQAEIDLAGVTSGERTFDLTAHQVRHPRELEVVQIVPGQLHLAFDTRLTRAVPVNPRLTGIGGEQIVKTDCDPPRVTITGPLHHVERVEAATTDPIDAAEASGTAVFTTNVYVPDPLVQVQPTSIRVTVVVQKAGTATSH
jgi:YbbR domain-containing protein